MNQLREGCTIAGLILRRELLALANSWKEVASSAFIYASLISLTAGYFMPAMGMPVALCAPLYAGAFIVNSYSVAYTCAIEVAFDLRSPKLGAYYYGLPVPFWMVMGARVLGMMVRILAIGVPVFILGFIIIGRWEYFSISWVGLVAMLVLTVQYVTLLFLALAHRTPLPVLLGNIWPRLLSPMAALGCAMYPFRVAAEKAWWLSRLMLLNPMVYCCEGMRAAFFGNAGYLNISLCIVVLVCVNTALWLFLRQSIVQAINPVIMRRV
ncbi:MAG: type transport system permease protein [Candidatus Dependentiae bacterium]|nr:type transport system permease protein [Candidatus Dependentiae bacterium]